MKFLVGLLLSFSMVAQAAIPASLPVESNKYENAERKYQITLPEGWQIQHNFMGLDVFAAAPEENKELGSRANMSVISTEGSENYNLEEYFNLNIENLKKALSEFKLIETGKVYFDGVEGRKLVYTHKINGLEIKATQYFVLKGKTGYVITCAAASDIYQKYADQFEQAVKTFKVKLSEKSS